MSNEVLEIRKRTQDQCFYIDVVAIGVVKRVGVLMTKQMYPEICFICETDLGHICDETVSFCRSKGKGRHLICNECAYHLKDYGVFCVELEDD